MATVQELAEQARKHFHQQKKGDREIWVHDDTAPKWVVDMAREAHAGMLPDDHKYEYIVAALDIVADSDADDTIDDIRESATERIDGDVDIYNHDLLQWLASNNERPGYVDEAVEELGGHSDLGILGDIAIGQFREREEVFGIVLNALEEQADVEDDEETD